MMRRPVLRLIKLILLTAVALLAGAISASGAAAASLSGAGSTLVAPLEAEWAAAFQAFYGAPVTYTFAGSDAGITAVSRKAVDFAASEVPLTLTQVAACPTCRQIPWALGAIGIGYHINGVGNRLRLTGSVVAQIYLGQITRWDDSRIQRLNPRVHMPALQITPVYRNDGSGDTYALTDYLTRISAAWRTRVGTGSSVAFPAGRAVGSDAGATSLLQSINGAVGYVAASYLVANQLPAAAIKNAAGNWEYPNLSNIESAAQAVRHMPASNELHIVNPPPRARFAYPISTFSYVIVPSGAPQAALLKGWILYALGPGQVFENALDFAKLPPIVLRASKATLNLI